MTQGAGGQSPAGCPQAGSHREGAPDGPTAASPQGLESSTAEREAASAGAPAGGGDRLTKADGESAEETESAGGGDPAREEGADEPAAHAAPPAETGTADAGRARTASSSPTHGGPQPGPTPQSAAGAGKAGEACSKHEQPSPAEGQASSVKLGGAALRPEQMIRSLARRSWGPADDSDFGAQRIQSSLGGGQAPTYDFAGQRKALSPAEEARLHAALTNLFDTLGARSCQPAPRWDARALVRELVSRRYALHRARQRRPLARVLILPDQSGSCAWISELTARVACALAARREDIAIAPTSWGRSTLEGVIADVFGRGAQSLRALVAARGPLSSVDHWRAIRGLGYAYVLVLGDVHGHRSYEAARDAGVRVLWIDPNGEDMPVRDTRRMTYVILREATASGLAQALEEAVRRCV